MASNSRASRSRRTTLADVARHCDVSVATVSAILGNKSYCYASQATRQRVLDAAASLNYQANVAAKALRGDRTGLIGVVLPSLAAATRVTIEQLAELEAAAACHQYSVLIRSQMSALLSGERAKSGASMTLPVDGIVCFSPQPSELELLREMAEQQGMPCVMTEQRSEQFSSTGVDRRMAGYLQVKHLLTIGRRKLAFILTSAEGEPGQEKLRGYEDALAEHGLSFDQFPVVYRSTVPKQEGFAISRILTRQLLAQERAFDGLVTMADVVAMGAVQELQSVGRRIPKDVAVVGFDDADFVPYLSVPLTTIHQPRAVGRVAFELLLEQIQAEPDQAVKPVHRWLEPELVVRASTVAEAAAGDMGDDVSCEAFQRKDQF